MTRGSLVGLILMSLIVATLAGCGPENSLDRQAVFGTVSLNKTPIVSGTIRFEPVAPNGIAAGATIMQGRYSIPAEKGLPVGEYVVRISAAGETGPSEPLPGDSSKLAEELVPSEYNTNSQLKATIKKGATSPQDFELSK